MPFLPLICQVLDATPCPSCPLNWAALSDAGHCTVSWSTSWWSKNWWESGRFGEERKAPYRWRYGALPWCRCGSFSLAMCPGGRHDAAQSKSSSWSSSSPSASCRLLLTGNDLTPKRLPRQGQFLCNRLDHTELPGSPAPVLPGRPGVHSCSWSCGPPSALPSSWQQRSCPAHIACPRQPRPGRGAALRCRPPLHRPRPPHRPSRPRR